MNEMIDRLVGPAMGALPCVTSTSTSTSTSHTNLNIASLHPPLLQDATSSFVPLTSPALSSALARSLACSSLAPAHAHPVIHHQPTSVVVCASSSSPSTPPRSPQTTRSSLVGLLHCCGKSSHYEEPGSVQEVSPVLEL